jgi:hypothetical protein
VSSILITTPFFLVAVLLVVTLFSSSLQPLGFTINVSSIHSKTGYRLWVRNRRLISQSCVEQDIRYTYRRLTWSRGYVIELLCGAAAANSAEVETSGLEARLA